MSDVLDPEPLGLRRCAERLGFAPVLVLRLAVGVLRHALIKHGRNWHMSLLLQVQ